MITLYWHDYETWGASPAKDKPAQFAGVRTDEDLNIVGEPLMIYAKPTSDLLPQPDACLITGITPQKAMAEGLPEPAFMTRIHAELAVPGTCAVGYNSLRFDGEVTRYGLYRNFYDPYRTEWADGNSRWDLIDLARMTYALRPEGIEWPLREDGSPSFKLEHLSAANGFEHANAHDALADVYATIELARLIRSRQPKLYHYAFGLRDKRTASQMFDWVKRAPVLHTSSRFPAAQGCTALVMPLATHPTNKNAVIVYDLSVDPAPLLALDADAVRERLYTSADDLATQNLDRIPLKLVHLNKSPMLSPVSVLTPALEQRLQLDMAAARQHWKLLALADPVSLQAKLAKVFSENGFAESSDPEQQLYGGFIPDQDKNAMARVQTAEPHQLAAIHFDDRRLTQLLVRYRARHYPETLTPDEQLAWEEWRYERLTNPEAGGSIVMEDYFERLAQLRDDPAHAHRGALLDALEAWGDGLL